MRALQPVSGMNYGAGKYERSIRAYRIFSLVGLIILLPFWLFVMFYPSDVLSVMIPHMVFSNNQLFYFRIYMSILPALPFIFMAMVWFPSVDHAKPATIISILRQIVFYIPALLIVPMVCDVNNIYIASAAIDWIVFGVTTYVVHINCKKLKEKGY